MMISENSRIRFYLLNGNIVVAEETFTISDLKNYYQQEHQKSRRDREIFINLCLYVWSSSYQGWKVATFDIE
ncbi:conserved hypothetical protein [Planktothrix paucivesiculata PCC 9631]|uniref:Uncharacterized protein n=1 Tax=Planktothrix paucivesiculata PCC 9631 TaxID=671071 RepID=A0A7Z9DX49_9CYAN|nr:conserved hypothetical protein [Planktothrix paucivesiculata PCC 9631]VXD16463.1 conserved hypothetical protein [Planktothrix paucivesiculata PCC 9631]